MPPGPGADGTGRVPVRVEVPNNTVGLRRSNSSNAGFDNGTRGRGQPQGVVVFEYREPVSSPTSSAPTLSHGGTPRVSRAYIYLHRCSRTKEIMFGSESFFIIMSGDLRRVPLSDKSNQFYAFQTLLCGFSPLIYG